MEYKKTIILLALVVFLLSIAGVSASEIDNTLASENANTIELSTDNDIEDNLQTSEENEALASTDYDEAIAQTDTDVLGADSATYSDLANEISQPGNITLTHKSYTYDERATAITISEANKVIDGNGAVIDMNGSTIRAFYISGSGVTIKNLTIKNANYDGHGGAIYFSSSATSGTVSNCNFTDNTASGDGGAINMGSGTVTNCNFVNNSATGEGSYGGAIRMKTGAVSNCNFTNNSASDWGGAIYMYSGTVKNCNFTDNTARFGGAVYFSGNGDVTNCNFTDNRVTGDISFGGAIFMYSGNVENCNFVGNVANSIRNGGGAVYFFDEGTVKNCNFTDNKASNSGGAVYFYKNVEGTVINCSFTNNSATNNGGAIYFDEGSTGRTINCNFTDNTASGNGGAVYFHSTGTVSNCNFTNNHASYGGAVYFWDQGTVTNCNFTDNTATGDGGAVYFLNTGNVTNCNFTGNTADYGGAVYFVNNGTVSNCNFVDNKATGDDGCGGAVFFLDDGTVSNCNFAGNNATGDGGAVFSYSSGNVTNCNFTDNKATNNGGAVYFDEGSNGRTINCNFVDNKATGDFSYGGAVYFNSNGEVTNCNFTNNTASVVGGAINMGTGYVTNCNFTNNSASSNGGAIYIDSGNVTNCYFTDNTANQYGGAVCFFNQGNVTNCDFINNQVTADNSCGGAVQMFSGNVTNCNFINNSATYQGGAIFNNICTVENCNFTGNKAITGSAIYFANIYSSSRGIIFDSTFFNNRANVDKKTPLNVTINEKNITITFMGQNNLLNAIYSSGDAEVTFNNVAYWGANGIETITSTKSGSNKEAGQNITIAVVVNDKLVFNDIKVTDENGTIVLDISVGENYYISVCHDTDSYYTAAEKTISNMKFYVNVTEIKTTNKTVNITAKSNIYSEFMPGKLLFMIPTGENITANYAGNGTWWAVYEFADYGDYQVNATYVGLDNVTVNNGTISCKISTEIIINTASLDLFVGDEIVIVANLTPADAGNVTFTSSNESVVEVDVQGNVIAQGKGQAIITVSFAGNNKYAAAENRTINVTVSLNDASVTVDNDTLNLKAGEAYAINATKHPDTIMLDITYTSSNSSVVTVDKKGIVTAVGVGTAVITVEVGDDEIYAKNSTNVTVTVSKASTEIGAKPVTATYNINKNLVITLKDANGNPVTGVSLSVDLNGAKKYTTDKNGQVKVSTKGLDPKTYTAKITFNGNAKYAKSSKNVKVTVKKATPKLTAKKKTYKTTTKTKKYTIVLKDNVGKAIKKAKVTLKVKGKTYKAKTNSKGKATFRIKNLKKKGTFKAVIKYKGNKYYKKLTKKAKIKVIVKFKTVSRGSKDKATVKEIQQALKDHGYYLTYQGHYLKIDGKFSSCTVRSIKQFQHDKGLKPTGKVDEKTAIKLGILK